MIAPRIALLAGALVLTASIDLFAQQEPPVAPGDRVRVTAWSVVPGRPVGTIVSLGADTCVVALEGRAEPLMLPLASVTRLEVSRGQRSNVGKGALTGGLIGTALGLLVGGYVSTDPEFFGEDAFAKTVAVLGGVGAGVGLLIGAMSRSDRWQEVPLDRLRVSTVPHRNGGLAIRVSVAF